MKGKSKHNRLSAREQVAKIEREKLEKAFSDGVGEGLTDPERPFTGKEYFDVKYKKP